MTRPFLCPESPMNDSISIAAGLAREYEGLRLKPYICPAGYWTIGYGNR
ncbi:glycoside hydrolase family protein, partial [Acetobacter persici]